MEYKVRQRKKEVIQARLDEWRKIEAGEIVEEGVDFKSIAPRIIKGLERELEECEKNQ